MMKTLFNALKLKLHINTGVPIVMVSMMSCVLGECFRTYERLFSLVFDFVYEMSTLLIYILLIIKNILQ